MYLVLGTADFRECDTTTIDQPHHSDNMTQHNATQHSDLEGNTFYELACLASSLDFRSTRSRLLDLHFAVVGVYRVISLLGHLVEGDDDIRSSIGQ